MSGIIRRLACLGLLMASAGLCPACKKPADSSAWSTKGHSLQADLVADADADAEVAAAPLFIAEPHLNSAADPMADLQHAAVNLLEQACASGLPQLRANAIEALHYVPESVEPAVQSALSDENRGVRFVAAMTVGKYHLVRLAPLVDPLRHDESPSVQAAAIFALRSCGHMVSPEPLGKMILSNDPEVKANAAIVLGELGNPTAAPMLRAAARHRSLRVSPARAQIVDIQIAEALVKLGDEREIESIRAALFSPTGQGEIRAFAAMILGRLKDEAYLGTLHDLAVRTGDRQEPAEVRMAGTMAVARMRPDVAPVEVPMAYINNESPALRAQAALTLGMIGRRSSLQPLQTLLLDKDPTVQVAAAGAILQILDGNAGRSGNQSIH